MKIIKKFQPKIAIFTVKNRCMLNGCVFVMYKLTFFMSREHLRTNVTPEVQTRSLLTHKIEKNYLGWYQNKTLE